MNIKSVKSLRGGMRRRGSEHLAAIRRLIGDAYRGDILSSLCGVVTTGGSSWQLNAYRASSIETSIALAVRNTASRRQAAKNRQNKRQYHINVNKTSRVAISSASAASCGSRIGGIIELLAL